MSSQPEPDSITFALAHDHADFGPHSHTFTVTLSDSVTISVADSHPIADPDTHAVVQRFIESEPDAQPVARAGRHPDRIA